MQHWTIGQVEIDCLVEVAMAIPGTGLIGDLTAEGVADHLDWLQPDYLDDQLQITVAIQSMLVRSQGRRILVDTCFGNDRRLPYPGMPPLQTDYLERLSAAGFDRLEVDSVVCTHLHIDHTGWHTMLTDGSWVPTFPNAEYLIAATELEHWSADPLDNAAMAEAIRPVLDAGLHRPVAGDHRITDEVRLIPTPGHTPGHVSVRIDSGGKAAVITGDVLHHPVQIARPEWASVPDEDPDAARTTRRALLEAVADADVMLIGTHFAAPSAGFVRVTGERRRWDAVVPSSQGGAR